jgi:hypothetical protein
MLLVGIVCEDQKLALRGGSHFASRQTADNLWGMREGGLNPSGACVTQWARGGWAGMKAEEGPVRSSLECASMPPVAPPQACFAREPAA